MADISYTAYPGSHWARYDEFNIERAHETAFEILSTHFPDHITPKADTNIRDRFPILLSRDAMKPSARCKKG